MRILIDFKMPLEPFNTLVRNGTAGEKLAEIMAAIKPEVAYFGIRDGMRGGILVVNVEDNSQIPSIAEPLFLSFNASIEFLPVMIPEDLMKADLDGLAQKWG